MRNILNILLILSSVSISSQAVSNSKIDFENLYGKWLLQNFYFQKKTNISELTENKIYIESECPFIIFSKDGKYEENECDYKDYGIFHIENYNILVEENKDMSSIFKFQIVVLNKNYLLINSIEDKPRTWFYKKLK